MKNVSFRGADLTGAEFRMCRVVDNVDLTDSNVTAEQFDYLQGRRVPGWRPVTYREYSVDTLSEITGMDKDEVGVLIWADNVEVRDNKTKRIVKGTFDKDKHHVPQWEAQRLVAAAKHRGV